MLHKKAPILFNGKLGSIKVRCEKCGTDYDIRDVFNETTHPGASHVARFDCPKEHRCEAKRWWTAYPDADFLKAGGISTPDDRA